MALGAGATDRKVNVMTATRTRTCTADALVVGDFVWSTPASASFMVAAVESTPTGVVVVGEPNHLTGLSATVYATAGREFTITPCPRKSHPCVGCGQETSPWRAPSEGCVCGMD